MLAALFLAFLPEAVFDINIKLMDSDDWKTRCRATKVIQWYAYNEILINKLEKISKDHPSLEVRRRTADMVFRHYNVSPTTYPKVPWIDCIPDELERQIAREKYLSSLEMPYHDRDYPNYRVATSDYVMNKMRHEGWSRKRARLFLDTMVDLELEQMKKNSGLYPEYSSKNDK